MTSLPTETVTTKRTFASSFASTKVRSKKYIKGFVVFIAVWNNRGRGEVVIGAPTLTDLADRWEQLTSSDFAPEHAQRVVFASADAVDTRFK